MRDFVIDLCRGGRRAYGALVATSDSSHQIGPERGRLILRTSRQGVASRAGHDLTIEVDRWSGVVVVADEPADSSVEVTVQLATLRVLEGTGGLTPPSDRDKREIAQTARRLLDTDRHPEATFVSAGIRESADGGVIEGSLTLRG